VTNTIFTGGETGSTNKKKDYINLPLIWEGRPTQAMRDKDRYKNKYNTAT